MSRYLITGATGLIGKALIHHLAESADCIYACCRSREKFDRCFGKYDVSHIIPVFGDICDLDIKNCDADYIIHAASSTASKDFVQKPVETIKTAVQGTINLLDQCKSKKIKGFVYLSSLEVYGQHNADVVKNITESGYGVIDPLAIRSSYSEAKRMCECLCAGYASEYGVPVKIARLAQTFGPGVLYDDNRVFAQFARSIIECKDIVLKTRGETIRNYCHTEDAVSAILTILEKGQIGTAYNIANKSTTISIADMAQLFCDLYPQSGSRVVFDIAENAGALGYNPTVKIQLDSTALEALGWKAKFGLEEMIGALIRSFV